MWSIIMEPQRRKNNWSFTLEFYEFRILFCYSPSLVLKSVRVGKENAVVLG